MARDRDLTDRQRQVLDYIKAEVRKKGFPPTVRDIGEAVGLSSSSTVHAHLAALEAKGLIHRDPSKPRALEILDREVPPAPRSEITNVVELPVIGAVAAGTPILATENVESTIHLPTDIVRDDSTFVLRVKGESMVDAGIFDGDYVVVRQQSTAVNGEIVVAMIDDEATVKRVYFEGDRVRFQPSNPRMAPIYVRDADFRSTMILGVVVGVYRKMA